MVDPSKEFEKIIGELPEMEQAEPTKKSAELTEDETKFYDLNKLKYVGLQQDIYERKRYAKYIFGLICVWLLIILLIVIAQGISFVPFTEYSFKLTDTVLVTLITTTTANIAAYFLVVTRYLFPNQK